MTESPRRRGRFLIATGALLSAIAIALTVLWGLPDGKFKNFLGTLGYLPLATSIVLGAFISQGGQTQNFNIPSEATVPTLYPGDHVVTYRFSAEQAARGDLVIIRGPKQPDVSFIKRIVGLPGEEVQVRNGEVLINGKALKHSPIEGDRTGAFANARYYLETTPEGKSYKVVDLTESGPLDNTPVQRVPEGHYWLLGDNRDNSLDSRVLAQFGYVPAANIYRKPVLIYWARDRSRIGRKVE